MLSQQNLLNELKGLNLSSYPIKKIRNILKEFSTLKILQLTLFKGKRINRARLNKPNEIFKSVSELNYIPSGFNEKFQRASIPFKTMFYGSIAFQDTLDEIGNSKVTAIQEVSELLRNHSENGEEKITISDWVLTDDIHLLEILSHREFLDGNYGLSDLYTTYQTKLIGTPLEVENNNLINEYLASEFAKSKISDHHDYLISALFSDMLIKNGASGILYPSVQAGGKGLNVAIAPHVVDNCMMLKRVIECAFYKKGELTYIDNDTISELVDNQLLFSLNPILDSQFHWGREKCYKKLNG